MGIEKREHERTPLHAKVQVTHESFGTVVARLENISHGGLFIIYCEGQAFPAIETIMQVQAMDMAVEAPILKVKIVRETDQGVGVQFLPEEE